MAKFKVDKLRKELINLKIAKVRSTLNRKNPDDSEVFSTIIDLIFVFEQLIKIKISEENTLLIYNKRPENSVIKAILGNEAVKGQHTLSAQDALSLYKVLFPKSEISVDSQGIELLIEYRNELQHHIVPFSEFDRKKILELARKIYSSQLKTLETVIGKISSAKDIKSTLTAEEIKELLKESVRRKIKMISHLPYGFDYHGINIDSVVTPTVTIPGMNDKINYFSMYSFGDNVCPRCGKRTFKEIPAQQTFRMGQHEAYYQCFACHLELTPEDYALAQEIMKEQ